MSDFDPARIMQEFYLSQYYEPQATRPADNVRAAIEFTIDRFYDDLCELSPSQHVGVLATRILAAAERAGLYVGIKIEARDRDGAEGGDANAAPVPQDRQARAKGIAETPANPLSSGVSNNG